MVMSLLRLILPSAIHLTNILPGSAAGAAAVFAAFATAFAGLFAALFAFGSAVPPQAESTVANAAIMIIDLT